MGLEIFYDLHAPAHWTREQVRQLVEEVHDLATTFDFAEVDAVWPHDPDAPKTMILKEVGDDVVSPPRVTATDGWCFRTWPGEGCETALFGLCYFPGTVLCQGLDIPTGWGEGWHYHTWCKTQYADRVSREHFLKCHLGVIAVLDAFRARGVEVNARDGSGYWDHRDKAELHRRLDEWNGIIAAFAGAFKDATENAPGTVISPIFSAPDFEHLEAEGQEILKRKRKEAGKPRGTSQDEP